MLNYIIKICMLWLSICDSILTTSIKDNLSGCMVPKGLLKLTNAKTKMQLNSESVVPIDTRIIYSCPTSYIWEGRATLNYCANTAPLCPPIRDHTIEANCEYKGESVNCKSNVKSGTIAQINCALQYVKPKSQQIYKTLNCQEDGTWDYLPFKCEQICGGFDKTPDNLININSRLRKPSDVPYHVNIYKIENSEYMHTCGGTIVQSKIVLSAAHCFWNDEKSLFYDKSKYIVTAGKFHLDYNSDKETFEVQRVLISKIDVPKTFRGSENNFEGDIAVLTLDNHIKFSDHVIPICVLWSTGFGQFNPNGLSGYVVGFNSNDSSTNGHLLREVPLTGIDTQKCQKYENVANYKIPDDKFCAYSENKTENICSRDGGGAFTIYDRGQLWLGGIFSNIITPNTSYHSGCDETLIRTFTNIYSHESFIKNVISNLSQAD